MLNMNNKPDAVGAGRQNRKIAIIGLIMSITNKLNKTKKAEFLAPLLFRLFLAPIFITAGLNKFMNFESTVQWFGNNDWGLGLPIPGVLAVLAIAAEIVGGFCLLVGFFTRWMTIPLIVTMLVALFTAHIQHGWHAIAPADPNTNIAIVTQYVGFPGAKQSLDNAKEVKQRLSTAKSILQQHGNYKYLTEKGSFVILNNGVEFAFIYLIMLLSLFFTGGGLLSLDYAIIRKGLPWLMRR